MTEGQKGNTVGRCSGIVSPVGLLTNHDRADLIVKEKSQEATTISTWVAGRLDRLGRLGRLGRQAEQAWKCLDDG